MHNLVERVLEYIIPPDTNKVLVHAGEVGALGRRRRHRLLERVELLLVVTTVGHRGSGELLQARILPLRVPAIVIDIEDAAVGVHALLPAGGQRADATLEVEGGRGRGLARARVHPRGLLARVVNEEQAALVSVGEVPAGRQRRLVGTRPHAIVVHGGARRRCTRARTTSSRVGAAASSSRWPVSCVRGVRVGRCLVTAVLGRIVVYVMTAHVCSTAATAANRRRRTSGRVDARRRVAQTLAGVACKIERNGKKSILGNFNQVLPS